MQILFIWKLTKAFLVLCFMGLSLDVEKCWTNALLSWHLVLGITVSFCWHDLKFKSTLSKDEWLLKPKWRMFSNDLHLIIGDELLWIGFWNFVFDDLFAMFSWVLMFKILKDSSKVKWFLLFCRLSDRIGCDGGIAEESSLWKKNLLDSPLLLVWSCLISRLLLKDWCSGVFSTDGISKFLDENEDSRSEDFSLKQLMGVEELNACIARDVELVKPLSSSLEL